MNINTDEGGEAHEEPDKEPDPGAAHAEDPLSEALAADDAVGDGVDHEHGEGGEHAAQVEYVQSVLTKAQYLAAAHIQMYTVHIHVICSCTCSGQDLGVQVYRTGISKISPSALYICTVQVNRTGISKISPAALYISAV